MNFRFGYLFDVAGTKSFRLSSRMQFDEIGGNVQNKDEEFRGIIIPDERKALIQVDQSGAEALIVAYLAGKGNYRRLFELGIKPHTYLALNIFTNKFRGKYPIDRYLYRTPDELAELPEWKNLNKFISKDSANHTEYQLGKKVAHAEAYAMGPETFRKQTLKESDGKICLSFQEAKNFLLVYAKLFPEIIEWQGKLIDEVKTTGVIRNLFGHPRSFYQRWNADVEREILSYIPQSTVGVLTSIVFTELFRYALANDLLWDILINVHDAVVAQVPISEAPAAVKKTRELFAIPLTAPNGEVFSMKSEGMIGATWNKEDMKEAA